MRVVSDDEHALSVAAATMSSAKKDGVSFIEEGLMVGEERLGGGKYAIEYRESELLFTVQQSSHERY